MCATFLKRFCPLNVVFRLTNCKYHRIKLDTALFTGILMYDCVLSLMGDRMNQNFLKMKKKVEHWQVISLLLVAFDFLAVIVSYFVALWVRYDCRYSAINPEYLHAYNRTILFYATFCVVVFGFMKLYKSIWRFASYSELLRSIISNAFAGVVYIAFMACFVGRMPISYFMIGIMLQFCSTLCIRFSYRFILLLNNASRKNKSKKHVMLIGAGAAGQMIFRDIKAAKETNERVCCFIDDNPNKKGRYIDNVPVYGNRDCIMEAVQKFGIEKIYVAIPSARPEEKRDILRICNETSCELMSLPGMYQLYTGEVSVSTMKPVQIEDLLGRDPIRPDMEEVFEYIAGKVVLITGVGSIGSEIARQIAQHHPKQLILFDIYENNAYDIQQELRKKYPNLKLNVIIGSVRDSRKIFKLFEQYRPEIVYHAAAHKHVPLMEDSPCEAIKNNAIGTYKTAYAAMTHGCKRFVLISTDKAVNPTNIMGASKRICEMIVQAYSRRSQTEFVAVRFGNVLGSNGSVIPLFKQQIKEGGPVTVTHPDIIRYFMTIPEAVSLVLQAGAFAHGGEIFVLDMGEPVKIVDLAKNLIRLSGYTPNEDIMIEYTGLRPGEKLYEERLMAEEGLAKTANDRISVAKPIEMKDELFFESLDVLKEAVYEETGAVRTMVQRIVPTYKVPKGKL